MPEGMGYTKKRGMTGDNAATLRDEGMMPGSEMPMRMGRKKKLVRRRRGITPANKPNLANDAMSY